MDRYIRKGLRFDRVDRKEYVAAEVLTLMGRKQAEFVAMLISDFVEANNIDPDNISRKELDAIIVLKGKGHRVEETQQTPVSKVTEQVTEVPEEPERDDEVDENLLSQMEMFG